MAAAQVCPVVGTTNTVLPPSHPEVDLDKPGQVCPVVGATTDHHHNLHKHPKVPIPSGTDAGNADACPALKGVENTPKGKELDEGVCPVVGPVTTVLPPDHPQLSPEQNGTCPVTKAKTEHHKGKVEVHPSVANAPAGAVCPVAGVGAKS